MPYRPSSSLSLSLVSDAGRSPRSAEFRKTVLSGSIRLKTDENVNQSSDGAEDDIYN